MESQCKHFKTSDESDLSSKDKSLFNDLDRNIENSKKKSCIAFHKLNCESKESLYKNEDITRKFLVEEPAQSFTAKRSVILINWSDPKWYSNSNPLVDKAYQEYLNAYPQIISTYFIGRYTIGRTNLSIYDTESEMKHLKIIETPVPLDQGSSITQLPNGDLFCFGKFKPVSGITFIINSNYKAQKLPSGIPCYRSTAAYFNRSVYCFGGLKNDWGRSTLSVKFDLGKNRWVKLAKIYPEDYCCNSLVFNRNILISRWRRKHLWIYSPDIDSFSTIPFEFRECRRKILAKAKRVYLIECGEYGSIYESEVEDEYDWKAISSSIISNDFSLVNCAYNKNAIYIGCIANPNNNYYKFNLSDNQMIKL